MANRDIDQKGKKIDRRMMVPVTLSILSLFAFGGVAYYQATAPEPDLEQQPVRFTAKYPNDTIVDQGNFLTFPQFEQYNGYGLENFVKNFENGTIQIGGHDRIKKAFQLFLTCDFAMNGDFADKWSGGGTITVHHRSGQDGLVETINLPNFGGDPRYVLNQVVSHSWMWTIFPGGEHKDQIWITTGPGTKASFMYYTLTAFDLPNKYHS